MTRLLAATALIAVLGGPAWAACTATVVGSLNTFECTSTQSATDGDDLALFFNSNGAPATTISGSLGKNSSAAGDQNINTSSNTAGGLWQQQGNGFGELKADGTISSFTDTPITGSTLPKSGNTFNGFDGMLIRGQVDATGATPWDGIVTMLINFSNGTSTTLTFTGNKSTGDIGTIGFDEFKEPGVFVNMVTTSVDSTGSFFEVKQFAFSVPGEVATIPEPSTWAMLISGFALLCGIAWKRKRSGLALDCSL